jgi:peroxiredoxin Q/BCP
MIKQGEQAPDPVAAVKRFHDKRSLNFTLLADEDHTVCELYGYEDGLVSKVLPKVSPKQHDDLVLAAL